MAKRKSSLLPKLMLAALTVLLIGGAMLFEYLSNRNDNADVSDAVMEVHVIDVGQGDSILVRCGDKTMLVDAGPPSAKSELRSFLTAHGVSKLNYVVMTHPHNDHIGGMQYILGNVNYGTVIMPDVTHTSDTFLKLLEFLSDEKADVEKAVSGTIYSLGDATFKILAPNSDDYKEMNDYSVVLKLSCKGADFILAGDAEEKSEKEIIERYGTQLNCDVLKVGHHGSDTSSSLRFITAVSPRYSAISAGNDNNYNHPNEEVVQLLKKSGSEVFVTKEVGTISFYVLPSGEIVVRTGNNE